MGFFTNIDNWLIAAAIVGQSLDVGTTAKGLQNPLCHEQVWPTQKAWVIGGAKAGATFTLAWGAKKTTGTLKTVSRIALVGAAVSGTTAGIINYNRCIR